MALTRVTIRRRWSTPGARRPPHAVRGAPEPRRPGGPVLPRPRSARQLARPPAGDLGAALRPAGAARTNWGPAPAPLPRRRRAGRAGPEGPPRADPSRAPSLRAALR